MANVFPTKDRNAEEMLTKGFNDQFVDVLIIHEYLTAAYLVFWTTVPVSRGRVLSGFIEWRG